MNKVQNGSSFGREKFKIPRFLDALLQVLRWFSYIILLDSGGRELRGLVLPCRPVVVDQPLLAAGPLCPGTASRPLQLLLRLGRSPSRLLSLLGGFSVTPSSPACSAPEAGLVSHSALRLPCGGILGLSRLSSPRPHPQLLPGRSNSFATAALLLPQLLPHSNRFSSTGPAFWRWHRRVGVQANSPLPPD